LSPPVGFQSNTLMIKIAVDAMGGDNAPEVEVLGALEALHSYGVGVILVGQENRILEHLPTRWRKEQRLEIVPASEVVTMEDAASSAFRRKKDSSLRIAANLVRDGKANGFVSAGNTGAVMTTAKLVMGSLEHVDRPSVAAVLPTAKGFCILLDVGANVDCKPRNLEQFAVMGHVYAHEILGITSPRVGLLSIGEEETKGNELTKEVHQVLKSSRLNYIGNIEGRDVYQGKADVIVCDGFIGNIALKISEGLTEVVMGMLRDELTRTMTSKVGAMLSKNAFRALKKRLDYSEYGGAPLLGVRGSCIICHGRSNVNAIKNAIRVAMESIENRVNQRIEKELISLFKSTPES
jgi:glycerol-3-phosphate acyltransferase PlsX